MSKVNLEREGECAECVKNARGLGQREIEGSMQKERGKEKEREREREREREGKCERENVSQEGGK